MHINLHRTTPFIPPCVYSITFSVHPFPRLFQCPKIPPCTVPDYLVTPPSVHAMLDLQIQALSHKRNIPHPSAVECSNHFVSSVPSEPRSSPLAIAIPLPVSVPTALNIPTALLYETLVRQRTPTDRPARRPPTPPRRLRTINTNIHCGNRPAIDTYAVGM